MNWQKKNYNIKLSDGTERFTSGISNGLFGLNVAFTLTHIKSGFNLGNVKSEAGGKAIGDYVAEHYADEFAVFNKAIKRNHTFEQVNSLPEKAALQAKLNADAHFQSLLKEHIYRPEKTDEHN